MKYKYGVEYETNGKKPDLPDDIRVERKFEGGWSNCNFPCHEYENWSSTVAFRICDQRYKPVESAASNEVEQVQDDWYDYNKQRAIGLPPVGVECEIWELDGVWRKVEVVAHTKKGLVVEWNGEEHLIYRERKFRPLKTEREWFIEAASKIMHQTEDGVINDISLGQLYDAGCRFTENKAAL